MDKKYLLRTLAHAVFRLRTFHNKCMRNFAKNVWNKTILEIGSGKKHRGKQHYSAKHFFDSSNTFIQSDIHKAFGHRIIDVTKMNYKNKFDIILCANVLEHVFDFHKAIANLYNAVKPNGIVVIFVPAFYPIHDDPHDYWRFTEFSLQKLLKKFKEVNITHSGIKAYPFGYYVEARK